MASPPAAPLRCLACRHAVTSEDARLAVAGAHRHTCVNPAGEVYRIGCFGSAPGLDAVGERVAEHTWFAGYTWQIAVCARCSCHLGWRFRGEEPPFEGLILERLVGEEGR